ncbi:MAG: repeat protein [Chthonomonadales bacterium]|nr:repeat protein [Chthonomonadales bacterium]
MATVRYTTVNGEVIAEKRGGVRSLYVPDPLGSTMALLDNTQSLTDTFAYWPYGESVRLTGSTPTPFQFVGTQGYFRDSSSTTYVRARVLDTTDGRWTTKDPRRLVGAEQNLYSYVLENPVTLMDRTGKSAKLPPRGGGQTAQPCQSLSRAACFACALSHYRSLGIAMDVAMLLAQRLCNSIIGIFQCHPQVLPGPCPPDVAADCFADCVAYNGCSGARCIAFYQDGNYIGRACQCLGCD